MKRILAILLLLASLGQSCTVYQKVPTAIENTVGQKRVMVINKFGDELMLNKVKFENGMYFAKYNFTKIQLDTTQIDSFYVFEKDIEKSKKKTKTTLIIFGSVVLAYFITYVILLYHYCC